MLSIVNVVGSSIARDSDDVLYTWAGPEIAVASTKAYNTQLSAIYLIALILLIKKVTISTETYEKYIEGLKGIPAAVEKVFFKIKLIFKNSPPCTIMQRVFSLLAEVLTMHYQWKAL